MKRSVLSLSMVLALLCSCQMQEFETPYEEDFSGKPEPREVTITASLATPSPETKTELERIVNGSQTTYKVYWLPGDQFRIFSAGETSVFTSQNTEPATTAPFKGEVSFMSGSDENGQPIYAYGIYPARADQVFDASSGTIQTYVPSVQAGKAGSFADDVATTIGRSRSLTFSFKSAYSGLMAKFAGNDIVSMTLRGANGETLAGRVTFGLDSSDTPVVESVSEPSSEVTLYAPDGETFAAGPYYYIVTLPGVHVPDGYIVTLRRSNGMEGTYSLEADRTFERNIFLGVGGNIDQRVTNWSSAATQGLNEIWYTSTNSGKVDYTPADGSGNVVLSNVYSNGRGKIRFASTLTEVDASAFADKTTLRSVTLPEMVETIGASAFYGCESLSEVNMGDHVTSIGNMAFYGCSFESIRLSESLESIGRSAFSNNSHLEAVSIPESVSSLGRSSINGSILNPFTGCTSLESFSGKYASADGLSLCVPDPDDETEKILVSFAVGGAAGSNYRIPDEVTVIGSSACQGAKFTGIDLNCTETIMSNAFMNCKLTSLTLPPSVSNIGSNAFKGCSDLFYIMVAGDGYLLPHGAAGMFANTGTGPIYVPEAWLAVYRTTAHWSDYADRYVSQSEMQTNSQIIYTADARIDTDFTASATSHEFSGGKGVLTFMDDVTDIPGNAFMNTALYSIVLPETVTTIGHHAFYNCTALSSVSLPDGIESIGGFAFGYCPFRLIHLPESLETIGSSAFYGCSALEAVTIPQSVTRLGDGELAAMDNPFRLCTSLSSFFGKFATEDHRFLVASENSADDLLVAVAPADLNYGFCRVPETVLRVAPYAFSASTFSNIALTNVRYLSDYAFNSCTSLRSITLPESVVELTDKSFFDSALNKILISSETPPSLVGGAFQNLNSSYIISVPGLSFGTYESAEGWSSMASHIAYHQTNKEIWYHLKGNDSLQCIASNSGNFGANYVGGIFMHTDTRLDATLPSGLDCGSDTQPRIFVVVFDGNITQIPYYAFGSDHERAAKFDYISVPGSVTAIGEGAFSGCSNLLNFPHSTTSNIREIGEDAFNGCTKMSHRSTVLGLYMCHVLGDGAFSNCKALKMVYFAQLQSLGNSVFQGCTGLTSVELTGTIQSVGSSTFLGCTGLETVNLPRTVTSIGDSAFEGCSNLTSFPHPSPVYISGIGANAFKDCISMAGDSYGYLDMWTCHNVGASAFMNCQALDIVRFAQLESLGAHAFDGCTGLTEAMLVGDVQSIGSYAFNNCSNLTTVTLGQNVKTIGDYAFCYASNLSQIKTDLETQQVLSNVESIGSGAFFGCQMLESISLPDIKQLSSRAFGTPKSLLSIRFGPNLRSVSSELFYTLSLDEIREGELQLYFEGNTPPSTVSSDALVYQNTLSSNTSTYQVPVDFAAIHVPAGSKSAYVTKLGSVFADKIVEDL